MTRCGGLTIALACLLAAAVGASAKDAPPEREIWLYTLVSADYQGEGLLPHFLEHYYNKGRIPYNRMLVNVHHNPAKYSRRGLDLVIGICASYMVYCRVWEGEFSSDAHYQRTLAMLHDFVHDPADWVVVADSDEFQDWGANKTIRQALSIAERAGATYVMGDLVDRLAPEGVLAPIAPSPRLEQQFPLACHVVEKLYGGWDFKVVAFRSFLRAGRANHIIVRPHKARAYFGPCTPGQKCPRGRNINLDADWFDLTPYAEYSEKYRYKDSPPEDTKLWDAVEHKRRVPIYHYKWHAGVVDNMRDRAQYYSGDCVMGVNEASCTPVMLHWRESAKTYAAFKDTGRLDISGLDCVWNATVEPEAGTADGTAVDGTDDGTDDDGDGAAGAGGRPGLESMLGAGSEGQAAHRMGDAFAGAWRAGADARQQQAQLVAGAGGEDGAGMYEEEGQGSGEGDGGAAVGAKGGEGAIGEGSAEAQRVSALLDAIAGKAAGGSGEGAGAEGGSEEEEEGQSSEESEGGDSGSGDSEQAAAADRGPEEEEQTGALEEAVEAITEAVEGGSSGGKGRGMGGRQEEDQATKERKEAELAQAEVDAAVQGAVQVLLHGEGEKQKALVEDDYTKQAVGRKTAAATGTAKA